jgi:DNA-binding HxlR family transcriptional regulator
MAGTESLEQAAHDGAICDTALVAAFGLLGKRWNGIILGTLGSGPVGFAELRRGIGQITDSVLSDRLTELATAGLIERSVTDARPPGVSYGLTAQGRALIPILEQLARWAGANLGQAGNNCPT